MDREHTYALDLRWTGNLGAGTATPRGYSRDHEVTAPGLHPVLGSSDPAFRGDPTRWNPEQLLVASLAQCHMLWYLGLAADEGIVVTAYEDHPTGLLVEESDGAGQFSLVTLQPRVTITDPARREDAISLHDDAEDMCFIARSVGFPVLHEPTIIIGDGSPA